MTTALAKGGLAPAKSLSRYVLQQRKGGVWSDLASDESYGKLDRKLDLIITQQGPGTGLRIIRRETIVMREVSPV